MLQRLVALLVLMIVYASQTFHRVYILHHEDTQLLEFIHVLTISVHGYLVFFTFGVTYDNIQLILRRCQPQPARPTYQRLSTPDSYPQEVSTSIPFRNTSSPEDSGTDMSLSDSFRGVSRQLSYSGHLLSPYSSSVPQAAGRLSLD